MRSNPPTARRGIALPLAACVLLSWGFIGCKQAEDLVNKATGKSAEEADAAKEAEPAAAAADESEAIPVPPMATGLDLMLSFIPDEKAEFVIVRDLRVVPEYLEESKRFWDGPMARIKDQPPSGTETFVKNYADFVAQTAKFSEALAQSGLHLNEGAAMIKPDGAKHELLVFAADDPGAATKFAEAMGETEPKAENCKAIDHIKGWNVCADNKADLDAYAPNGDAPALKASFAAKLPGVDLEEANALFNVTDKDESTPIVGAATTLPGFVHVAFLVPADNDKAQFVAALKPGAPEAMANVQPGAGFVWARTDPAVLKTLGALAGDDMPPELAKLVNSLTGEFVLAGSVAPSGMFMQAGMTDTAAFEPVLGMLDAAKAVVPASVPKVPGSKLTAEKTSVDTGGTKTEAFHVVASGVAEADALKAFAALHAEAWTFADGKTLTVALGPDAQNVGKLASGAGGVSAETLATLPGPLAAAMSAGDVAFAMHAPMDYGSGAHMKKLAAAALKNLPGEAERYTASAAFFAPLSSASLWVTQPAGGATVAHVAVQGIGNRVTPEGQEALAAAHAVSIGGDPAAAFGPLVTKYPDSPMAFAYATRAGTDGPGGLVGSGIGAAVATAMLYTATAEGKRNEELAADLGVKPDDPEPVVAITTKPKAPVHKKTDEPKADPPKKDPPKKDEPKEPGKYEPKADPEKDEPKPDPEKDEPVVEPDRPTPPVPKPSVDPDKPKRPIRPGRPKRQK